jgi:hypothetical protein
MTTATDGYMKRLYGRLRLASEAIEGNYEEGASFWDPGIPLMLLRRCLEENGRAHLLDIRTWHDDTLSTPGPCWVGATEWAWDGDKPRYRRVRMPHASLGLPFDQKWRMDLKGEKVANLRVLTTFFVLCAMKRPNPRDHEGELEYDEGVVGGTWNVKYGRSLISARLDRSTGIAFDDCWDGNSCSTRQARIAFMKDMHPDKGPPWKRDDRVDY